MKRGSTISINPGSYEAGPRFPDSLYVSLDLLKADKRACGSVQGANACRILLMTKGHATLRFKESELLFNENELLVIPPDVDHLSILSDKRLTGACIYLAPAFFAEAGIAPLYIESMPWLLSGSHTRLQLTSRETARFMSVISLLGNSGFVQETHPFAADVIRHSVDVFQFELAGFLLKYGNTTSDRIDRKRSLFRRFLLLLHEHGKTQRSVQFYAAQLFVTPKYLTQAVKEVSGETAGDYIDKHTIAAAKRLLRDPELTLAQVADSLYFSSQFFFSKFFKRCTGSSPSAFRQGR